MANDPRIDDEDFGGLTASHRDRSSSVDGFESVGTVTGGRAVKGIFSKANRTRLWLFAGVALLLVGAIMVGFLSLRGGKVENSNAPSGVIRSGRMNSTTNAQTTLQMQQEADRYNEQTLPEVQADNPTAHPVMVDEPAPSDPDPYKKAATLSKAKKVSEVGSTESQGNTGGQSKHATTDTKQLDKLIEMMLDNEGEGRKPELYSVQWDYSPTGSKERGAETHPRGTGVADGGTDQEVASTKRGGKCKPIVRAGSQFLATSDLAVNSDIGGPIAITVRNGKLRDLQMIGKFERKEEFLRIELTQLVLPDETVSINAIALDVNTTLNAVSGDVDSHLLYRYGWWGFGTLLKAIGSAAEKNADNNIIISDGTVVQSTKEDSSREIKMMLGSLGADTGSAFQEALKRPITVSLAVDEQVGVFFIDDVCRKSTTDI